jgi:hypothetical protein
MKPSLSHVIVLIIGELLLTIQHGQTIYVLVNSTSLASRLEYFC